jgi:L,D-transpeptidase-like protein
MSNLVLVRQLRSLFVLWLDTAKRSYGRVLCSIGLSVALTMSIMPVSAAVLISVNKNAQQMSVSVNGVSRYRFAVSTGRAGYGTPNGTYHPQWMAKSWFSKEYYNSPMPHSIFFHRGYAIHGSYEINRLGGPASHGCIRLHPDNASQLFALVQREGMAATTIVVYGSNPAILPRRALPVGSDNVMQPDVQMQPNREPRPEPSFFPFFGLPHNLEGGFPDPGRMR